MVLSAAIFVACNRSFTNDISFHAPAGWVYSVVPSGGEVWLKRSGSRESIMAQAVDNPLPARREPGWKDISICGGHHAVLMVQNQNQDQIWEGVSTNWGSRRYMAVYVRPNNVSPDLQAEAAIRSLCLKNTR